MVDVMTVEAWGGAVVQGKDIFRASQQPESFPQRVMKDDKELVGALLQQRQGTAVTQEAGSVCFCSEAPMEAVTSGNIRQSNAAQCLRVKTSQML